jgi:hypothetical protein
MTLLSLLYKAAKGKNLTELRISSWELNEEKYSEWVIDKLRCEDPSLEVISTGIASEGATSLGQPCSFELHRFKIASKLKPKEIKDICTKLEMPGVLKQPAYCTRWEEQNHNRRLADIDVYVPGILMKQRITRYKK